MLSLIIILFIFPFIQSTFNLNEIYPKKIINLNTIKIIHKTKKSEYKPLCVFGVLENNNGLQIEKEMLKWLIPNYNLYIVYQKNPGKLYEYPALRFAQWLIKKKNKNYLLYIHSKGASHPNRDKNIQIIVRKLQEYEFSGNNKNKYINSILTNKTDVATLFSYGRKKTWFNGFFISKRAFDIIGKIKKKKRMYYERMFVNTKTRVLGILNNKVINSHAFARKFYNKFKLGNKKSDL